MPVHATRRASAPSFLIVLAAMIMTSVASAQPAIPNYWDEKERLPRPDLSSVERLRFLTTIDFPPFNFIDRDGRLSGFHVDLATAICAELGIVERCQIQALPWDELDAAMAAGEGEALIAGTAISSETRERYAFSRPYLRFPARFAAPRASTLAEPMHAAVDDRRIGVLAGSRHEAMLRTYFTNAQPVTFTRGDWMFEALLEGNVDAVFDDGMRLSFWLGGTASKNCCHFVGGPYLAPEFLGAGLAIAAGKDQALLVAGFDYALREINLNGTFAELYLKYFPISFY
jgi:polar amino acid transport system substrate-binding protein